MPGNLFTSPKSIAYFANISIFLLTFPQFNAFQAIKSCIIEFTAGEQQEQAYPTTH